MIRLTVTELRRSNAATMALLTFLTSVAALATSVHLWRGRWLAFSYNHSTMLLLLVPLALAGGAVLGRRERRTRAEELTASTGRPKWQRTAPAAAAIALAVTAAHLLVFAAGAALAGSTASYTSAGPLLLPFTDVVILTGAAWLGLAAGRAWPSPLVPPALAVVMLAVQVGLAESPVGSPLYRLALLAQPPSFDWEAITGRALFTHLLLGAGLAVGGFLLAAAASWLPRLAGAAVVAAAVLAVAAVPVDRYYVDPAAQRLVCAAGTPQVCVTAVHAFALDEATPRVRQALTLLAKLPGAPTRAVEWRADAPGLNPAGVRTAPGTVQFDLGLDGQQIDPHLVDTILAAPGTWQPDCRDDADGSVAWSVAGAWLSGTEGTPLGFASADAEIRDTLTKLRALPPAEQTRRVTAMRDAAAKCSLDVLPILTGEAHP